MRLKERHHDTAVTGLVVTGVGAVLATVIAVGEAPRRFLPQDQPIDCGFRSRLHLVDRHRGAYLGRYHSNADDGGADHENAQMNRHTAAHLPLRLRGH